MGRSCLRWPSLWDTRGVWNSRRATCLFSRQCLPRWRLHAVLVGRRRGRWSSPQPRAFHSRTLTLSRLGSRGVVHRGSASLLSCRPRYPYPVAPTMAQPHASFCRSHRGALVSWAELWLFYFRLMWVLLLFYFYSCLLCLGLLRGVVGFTGRPTLLRRRRLGLRRAMARRHARGGLRFGRSFFYCIRLLAVRLTLLLPRWRPWALAAGDCGQEHGGYGYSERGR